MILFTIILIIQVILFLFFLFFAFYNYRYQIASLFKPKIKKVPLTHFPKVAIIIVCRNEKLVIRDTITACEKLSYPNKTIIVGDDSNDFETMEALRNIAESYQCKVLNNKNRNTIIPYPGVDEVYESEQFVLFHRENNVGFKAGNIKNIERYLKTKGFEYMYLLDADWHPEPQAIEKCLEVIETDSNIAFVQTRRDSYYGKSEPFKRCLGMMEEACYYVDLVGRQVVGDMILFTGCCALLRLSYLEKVGGFMPGHLTEDIDLSNRFYLAGYKGIYLESVQNTGEVPPNYKSYRKQQDRWAKGSAKVLKDYFGTLLFSKKIDFKIKISTLRQNTYFSVALGTEFSMILSVIVLFIYSLGENFGVKLSTSQHVKTVVVSLNFFFESIGFRLYLYHYVKNALLVLFPLVYSIFLSSLLHLVITIVKKREWQNILYIPLVWWLNLSIIHTYFLANLVGLKNGNQSWFLTPKTNRTHQRIYLKSAWGFKLLNLISLILIIMTYYVAVTYEKVHPALIIPYAVGWIPAFIIGSIKS